jgi:hypothetical protein
VTSDIWSVPLAILTSVGGGAVIVVALVRWLAEVTAKRILQNEQHAILKSLEELKQELGLARLTYDKHVQQVVEYYGMFYKSYQLCQLTAGADITRRPGLPDLDLKGDYLNKIDSIADEWNAKQGVLRLVLPHNLLRLHEQAISELNRFKDCVTNYRNSDAATRTDLQESFKRFDALKQQLEKGLREHLRTDKV